VFHRLRSKLLLGCRFADDTTRLLPTWCIPLQLSTPAWMHAGVEMKGSRDDWTGQRATTKACPVSGRTLSTAVDLERIIFSSAAASNSVVIIVRLLVLRVFVTFQRKSAQSYSDSGERGVDANVIIQGPSASVCTVSWLWRALFGKNPLRKLLHDTTGNIVLRALKRFNGESTSNSPLFFDVDYTCLPHSLYQRSGILYHFTFVNCHRFPLSENF